MACHSIGLALRALPTNSPVQSSEQAPIYVITLFNVCLYKYGLEGVESQVYYMIVAPLFFIHSFQIRSWHHFSPVQDLQMSVDLPTVTIDTTSTER